MAEYELVNLTQSLNEECSTNGLREINVSYVVVQKPGQSHPSSRDKYPEFFLVPNEGLTITPTRCFVVQSSISLENLQQITLNLNSQNVCVPRCLITAEEHLNLLKNSSD